MSSIESASVSIPATSAETFAPLSVRDAQPLLREPAAFASRITATRPAADTRLGSPKSADTAVGTFLNCIDEMLFG